MRTYRTRAAARRACREGEAALYGRGEHGRPWLVADAGTVEDLLADDLGREQAHALLSRLWVIDLDDLLRAAEVA